MVSQPINLAMEGDVLAITWDDGEIRHYEVTELRRHCPCATCNTAREHSESSLLALTVPPGGLKLTAMTPVGNYAYRIHFSDRHATGIYPLELLRALGRRVQP